MSFDFTNFRILIFKVQKNSVDSRHLFSRAGKYIGSTSRKVQGFSSSFSHMWWQKIQKKDGCRKFVAKFSYHLTLLVFGSGTESVLWPAKFWGELRGSMLWIYLRKHMVSKSTWLARPSCCSGCDLFPMLFLVITTLWTVVHLFCSTGRLDLISCFMTASYLALPGCPTRDKRPPSWSNVFIFMQFWGKLAKIIGWYPWGLRVLIGLPPPPPTTGQQKDGHWKVTW